MRLATAAISLGVALLLIGNLLFRAFEPHKLAHAPSASPSWQALHPPPSSPSLPPPLVLYVFATFTDGATLGEGLHVLVSSDGLAWRTLQGALPPLAAPSARVALSLRSIFCAQVIRSCCRRVGWAPSSAILPSFGMAAGFTLRSRPSCASDCSGKCVDCHRTVDTAAHLLQHAPRLPPHTPNRTCRAAWASTACGRPGLLLLHPRASGTRARATC